MHGLAPRKRRLLPQLPKQQGLCVLGTIELQRHYRALLVAHVSPQRSSPQLQGRAEHVHYADGKTGGSEDEDGIPVEQNRMYSGFALKQPPLDTQAANADPSKAAISAEYQSPHAPQQALCAQSLPSLLMRQLLLGGEKKRFLVPSQPLTSLIPVPRPEGPVETGQAVIIGYCCLQKNRCVKSRSIPIHWNATQRI